MFFLSFWFFFHFLHFLLYSSFSFRFVYKYYFFISSEIFIKCLSIRNRIQNHIIRFAALPHSEIKFTTPTERKSYIIKAVIKLYLSRDSCSLIRVAGMVEANILWFIGKANNRHIRWERHLIIKSGKIIIHPHLVNSMSGLKF